MRTSGSREGTLSGASPQTHDTEMKLLLLFAVVGFATAQNQPKTLEEAGILRMDMTQDAEGQFTYGYETTDPITVDVTGGPKQIGDEIGMTMQGSYSYTAPDGNVITVTWTADENGFQPSTQTT